MHNQYGCFEKVGQNGCDDGYCMCGAKPPRVLEQLRSELSDQYRCKTHPRYQAKGKPRSTCEGCWRLWIALNPT